jgi:hypothetical protein
MPKAKAGFTCSGCSKSFKSERSLSLHEYHSNICGYSCFGKSGIAKAAYQDIEEDMYEDSFMEHNEHDDTVVAPSDQANSVSVPFLLTKDDLRLIPGGNCAITHSTEQRVHVELLQLLLKAEAPDYLFKDIIDWASRAKASNYNFNPILSTRSAVLSDLKKHFNLQNLRPKITELKLESINEQVPIVSFDLKSSFLSLLTNTDLMQPENLVINDAIQLPDGSFDYSPWFHTYLPGADEKIHEVLSGRWYQKTVESLKDVPNLFLCPLILYVDSTFIDPGKSRFNLEPFNLTLAIFKLASRLLFHFWTTFGYVPETPELDEAKVQPGCKARNYHAMLEYLLQELIAIHANPTILDNFPLRIGDQVQIVNLRIPVAFIISDTKGADQLCGRYISYAEKVKRLHRTCTCAPADATNTTDKCSWVLMDAMMNIIDRGDKEELNQYSQNPIPNHAFRYINFGANPHGIYGATPNDLMHGLKLGIIPYLLEIFYDVELNASAKFNFNQSFQAVLPHLKQGCNKQFPRLYFPNGITSLKNLTAEERYGIMFVAYILCNTSPGRASLARNETMSIARINQFVVGFEKLLILEAWTSKCEGYWRLNDVREQKRASRAVEATVEYICDYFPRNEGQGWNLSKMHELLHISRFIDLFGSPMNFDTGACERMHKDIAKKPGRQSQKRHATFTLQAANRLADRHALDLVENLLTPKEPVDENDDDVKRKASPSGSTFLLRVDSLLSNGGDTSYRVTVDGCGVLSSDDLGKHLYPDLIEFIVAYFATTDTVPKVITCRTEYRDEDGITYRAHHQYRGNGIWHDWGWVSYENESNEDGFVDVPAKLLCFLPDGVPGNNSCHAVCHPCQWKNEMVSKLIRKWSLVPCSKDSVNKIPFDIVPVSSLFGQCFIVPDLQEDGTVYEVLDKELWADKMY